MVLLKKVKRTFQAVFCTTNIVIRNCIKLFYADKKYLYLQQPASKHQITIRLNALV